MTFKRIAALAVVPLLSVSSFTLAQEEKLEEIVVTGSYIKGTPGDSALPVQVLDRSFIEGIGANSVADVIANLAISSGAENQTDSFTQGSTQGTANINLRGLGLSSTLVLINGRRQTISGALANDGSVFVDTSSIPINALERVEVLKEGAASTYGSDAIAGVVNLILRKDFDGFELSAITQQVSDGDQDDNSVGFIWGRGNDTTHVTFAGNYLDRSALSAADRPNLVDQANSSLGSSFIALPHVVGLPSVTVDSGPYAGTYTPGQYIPNANCSSYSEGRPIGDILCGFAYGPRFNLVAAETRTQVYANLTHDFANGAELAADLGYSSNEVTENPQSPSYPDLTFPVIGGAHPSNPIGVPLAWLGRPFAFGYPSPNAPRENDTFRTSVSLNGTLENDWAWNTAVTHSNNKYKAFQPDTIASRLKSAFIGQGGPNGDEFYDPFVPENNSQALYDHLSYMTETQRTTGLTVIDAVITGDLMTLASGSVVEMAAGIQLRREGYKTETDDLYEITFDANGNPVPIDLIFLGGVSEIDQSRSGYSAFAEAKIPLGEAVEITTAVRYESLDSGSSVDPKLAVRWQVSEHVALRASASTAFREPSLSQINAQIVQLEGIQDYNADGTAKGGTAFIRVTQSGSPDLKAEESDNFNVGIIVQPTDSLDFKLDYWTVDYTDLITVENAQGKILADINGPDILRTATGTLAGINVDYFNSSSVDVSGIDFESKWVFSDNWTMGVNIARMLKYDITLPTGAIVDALGEFNRGNFARSLPETKGNMHLGWASGNQNANLNVNYITSYKNGADAVDSYTTVDAQYGITISTGRDDHNLMLSIGAKNLLNEEPPRVIDAANYSFDPKQHSAVGRAVYVKANYSF